MIFLLNDFASISFRRGKCSLNFPAGYEKATRQRSLDVSSSHFLLFYFSNFSVILFTCTRKVYYAKFYENFIHRSPLENFAGKVSQKLPLNAPEISCKQKFKLMVAMVEQEIVEFDEVYDPDIENAQQREYQATSREARHLAIILREKQIFPSYLSEFLPHFDSPVTQDPILELVKSYSPGLIETSVIRLELHYKKGSLENHLFRKCPAIEPESCRKWVQIAMQAARGLAFLHRDLKSINLLLDDKYKDLKASNMLLDTSKFNNHAIDAGDFTALNIPPASPRCRKTDVKIEKTVQLTGALRAKNINEKASSEQNRSYLQKTCPEKVRNESRFNIYHVLLLISTLLATITFHTALKFYLPGCRFQEGYESSSSLNSICQIENQRSYSNRILITFNSVVFFVSTALMMILFNELPFRPWLLVLVFSMIGSYMCTFKDPVNPSLLSS
ncbi:hypothetical protein EZV62_005486 [Acer yangbiense]|uniref:Protein kinase domain-containing protein n=1 Tax=Acer yangbiense TaxID=1000413 RepID=A0A5C7IMR2_9ROSI|nr:hypothetical protein EZV62_005486 [Acer yangbiense]